MSNSLAKVSAAESTFSGSATITIWSIRWMFCRHLRLGILFPSFVRITPKNLNGRLAAHRLPQRLIDPRLPAGAGLAEMLDDIGVQANADRGLWSFQFRAADRARGANDLIALPDLG